MPYAEDGRTRYQQAIDGMGFGESREQGVTRGRHFYHEELGIALTAPQGGRIQNSPQAIIAATGAGDAALVVRLIPPQAGKTHAEIMRNVIKPVEGNTQARNLNGLAATQFAGVVRNSQGQQANARVTLVSGPHDHNYLLQYAARDASTLQRSMGTSWATISRMRWSIRASSRSVMPWLFPSCVWKLQ